MGGDTAGNAVLLVEDSMTDVRAITRRLRDAYSVRHVRTGAAGLELVRREPFQAILLDERLPDMSGSDVCAAMREAGVAAPIIVLSALEDDRLAQRALAAGATDYLVKDLIPHLPEYLSRRLVDA